MLILDNGTATNGRAMTIIRLSAKFYVYFRANRLAIGKIGNSWIADEANSCSAMLRLN